MKTTNLVCPLPPDEVTRLRSKCRSTWNPVRRIRARCRHGTIVHEDPCEIDRAGLSIVIENAPRTGNPTTLRTHAGPDAGHSHANSFQGKCPADKPFSICSQAGRIEEMTTRWHGVGILHLGYHVKQCRSGALSEMISVLVSDFVWRCSEELICREKSVYFLARDRPYTCLLISCPGWTGASNRRVLGLQYFHGGYLGFPSGNVVGWQASNSGRQRTDAPGHSTRPFRRVRRKHPQSPSPAAVGEGKSCDRADHFASGP
ncbi:hypothetical protein QBC47DRAFT_72269 [Echria macrotheca]|uniref:Uncharacterized protein n=1 Tax=Echria macrotheca TaxID=438768 RepID=A0AAJ0B7J2_9PEZI|nr:hypothetical protein QBC47DRAFT_72269 [Echria macrotheca]